MEDRKMKKLRIFTLIFIVLVAIFGLGGCFNGGVDNSVPDIVVPNGGLEHSPQEDQEEILIGTGTYVGQIDNNSVEIIISGAPEDMATRAFRFSPELREKFDSLGLEDNSPVKFEYAIYNQDQWMLMSIDPM